MKKQVLLIVCLLMGFFSAYSEGSFTENFETGMPTSAPSSEVSATLSSGVWKLNGVLGKSDNGSMRATMNGNGYIITPLLNKPTSLSFIHRGSGSNKVLNVYKSINNGATWSSIGSATVGSASAYGSSSMAIGEPGTKGVLVKIVCTSATIYIDDITIGFSDIGDEPTQPASMTASNITGNSMTIEIAKGDGDSRLLVYAKGAAPTFIPEDGVAYKSLPKLADNGDMVVYCGDDSQIAVAGLEAGESYHFAIYESIGAGAAVNYLTSSVGRLSVRTLEVASFTSSTSSIGFGSLKVGNTDKRTFTLSGRYLTPSTGSILLTGDPNFQLSTDNIVYATTLTIDYTLSSLPATTIYVRFAPSQLRSYSSTILAQGAGASLEIAVKGIGSNSDAKYYYISPTGNDYNEGTFDSPWYNLQKAVNVVVAGDTIICRGGVYYPNMMADGSKTTVRMDRNKSGMADKRIGIVNYPGEFPIFNFKDQPKKLGIRGMLLAGDWWYIKGLHITEAGDNGIKLEGSHNIIERCTFSYNDDTGLQLGFGHNFSDSGLGSSNNGEFCAYNDIIDCDSYLNCDADNFGSDADGFACKMHNGKQNRFIRCRAWDNSDDAWDLYETDYAVYLIECWAWGSGRANLFGWVQASGSFQGNGNGIKMGGNGTGGSSKGIHEAWNCVAFNCNKSGSVKGFDQNSHGGGNKLVNCLAFGCGYDFMFEKSGSNTSYYNNVCLGNIEIASGGVQSNNAMLSSTTKAWSDVVRGFSAADYVSLSEEDAKAPRSADGAMPKRFARLKSGSVLLNKGLSMESDICKEYPFLSQPIYGGVRDLGPYELEEGEILSESQIIVNPNADWSLSIYPNPVVREAIAKWSVNESSQIEISLYNTQGQKVSTVLKQQADKGIEYYTPIDVTLLPKGVYIVELCTGNARKMQNLIVTNK